MALGLESLLVWSDLISANPRRWRRRARRWGCCSRSWATMRRPSHCCGARWTSWTTGAPARGRWCVPSSPPPPCPCIEELSLLVAGLKPVSRPAVSVPCLQGTGGGGDKGAVRVRSPDGPGSRYSVAATPPGLFSSRWMRRRHVRFCRYRFPATDLNSKATWFGIQ
jgi:hypothetical protein